MGHFAAHVDSIILALWPVAVVFVGISIILKRSRFIDAVRIGWRESMVTFGLFAINYALFVPVIAYKDLMTIALVPDWSVVGHEFGTIPFPVVVLVTMLLIDVTAYWRHRFEHTSFMWRFHATHHSDRALNWFSVKRKHPIAKLFEVFIDAVPAIMLGASLPAIAMAQLLRGMWGYFIHADVPWTLGPLRRVLISPAAHRLHHIRDEALMGTNYANTFAFIDVAFGTFADPAPHIGCETGIAEGSRGVFGELLRPWERRYRLTTGHSSTEHSIAS